MPVVTRSKMLTGGPDTEGKSNTNIKCQKGKDESHPQPGSSGTQTSAANVTKGPLNKVVTRKQIQDKKSQIQDKKTKSHIGAVVKKPTGSGPRNGEPSSHQNMTADSVDPATQSLGKQGSSGFAKKKPAKKGAQHGAVTSHAVSDNSMAAGSTVRNTNLPAKGKLSKGTTSKKMCTKKVCSKLDIILRKGNEPGKKMFFNCDFKSLTCPSRSIIIYLFKGRHHFWSVGVLVKPNYFFVSDSTN